jgi:hypothetical protein
VLESVEYDAAQFAGVMLPWEAALKNRALQLVCDRHAHQPFVLFGPYFLKSCEAVRYYLFRAAVLRR